MFTYFPDNYAWNLALGLSIGMGAEMAEVEEACRPLLALGTTGPVAQGEAWFQNWARIAQHVRGLAEVDEARGCGLSAAPKFFRAANYFLMAERNMAWSDARRVYTYRQGLAAFTRALSLASTVQVERVDVPYAGGSLAGWLSLPPGVGPHPAVIFLNGLDSVKETHFLLYHRLAAERGLAVLFVDQEGTGEAVRLQFHAKRHDSEVSAGLFVDFLQQHHSIIADRIGVVGLSAGGYDAPRAAAFEKRLHCAASFGGLYNLDTHRAMFLGQTPPGASEGLSNQREHLRHVTGAATDEEAVRRYEKRTLGPALPHLTCPLLIAHGENDRQVPLWHAERTVAEAVHAPSAELRVFTLAEGGAEHCGIDNVTLPGAYVFDWLARQLGGAVTK